MANLQPNSTVSITGTVYDDGQSYIHRPNIRRPERTRQQLAPVVSHDDARNEMLSYKKLEDGWDDVSSKAISAEVVDVALEFLAILPSGVSVPEASASGDGTVDWYWRNGSSTAIVTFYPGGQVAYCAMTDADSVKGSFRFSESIPYDLVKSVQQF